ncbi:DNA-processing protein DprA [Streptosporangium sp. NBC_01810]
MNDRLARLTLMRLAEPGDTALGALVALRGPQAAVTLVREGGADADFTRWFADTHGRPAGGSGPCGGDSDPRGGGSGAPDVGSGAGDGRGAAWDGRLAARFDRTVASWAARLRTADPERDLAEGERIGARLVIPGDAEWPSQLDDLGGSRPHGLWLRGDADLRFSCLRSVAVVGSRAATPYGAHVAAELGAGLSERGWGVVSGGA